MSETTPNRTSRTSRTSRLFIPRDAAGGKIVSETTDEPDDVTEVSLENDARMVAFLSSRKRNRDAR